tara:strand:- start:425 stop:1132 length:708 start_codon:yes stop_codon:yes gene_type:complete
MINLFKNILVKFSRVIFWITPEEFRLKTLQSKLIWEQKDKENFEHFQNHYKKSILFNQISSLRKHAIENAVNNDPQKNYYYLEFGVWKGESANFFSKYLKKLYVFDGFEGLKEDWAGTGLTKGSFNLGKKIPKLNSNIEPIVGWVEDTLDDFLKKHNPEINFVHLDMDTYSPTKYTLEKLKPYLIKGATIIFDELYNYPGWKEGEYKALKEVYQDDEYNFLAFNLSDKQVSIQIK